jgi:hypothetical protein
VVWGRVRGPAGLSFGAPVLPSLCQRHGEGYGELDFVLFADDTNLFAEGHNPAGLFERVNGGWLNLAGGSGVIGLL